MPKKTKLPMTQRNYRENKGMRCPGCRKFAPSMHVMNDPSPMVKPNGAFVKIMCRECGATWVAEFQPVHYDTLREGSGCRFGKAI